MLAAASAHQDLDHAVHEVFRTTHVQTFSYGPGSAPRQTRRVHFHGESIIASCRRQVGLADTEIDVLVRLRQHGVAVPNVLGRSGSWYFQEDLGPVPLSAWLNDGCVTTRVPAIESAIEELRRNSRTGSAIGLNAIVPTLDGSQWAAGLAK